MFIPAPLLLGDGTFDEITGNNYTFNLSNEVESLLPFWRVTDIAPTDLIIDIDNTFLIDADGSFMFEPI